MFKSFLSYLEKRGRKYAFVDFYGDVLFYRYYLFFVEKHIDERFIAKLPNIFIHVYVGDKNGDGPNMEGSHSHPWSTLGFLIKGSYKEIIDEKYERTTKRFGFAYTSHKEKHKIVKVEPGTTSIFMHGFRKKQWLVHMKSCENVCQTCQTTNNGVCNKTTTNNLLDDHLQITHNSIADGKSWRALTLLKVDENFKSLIDRRKKSLKKMNFYFPETMKEKAEIVKIAQIAKRNEIK